MESSPVKTIRTRFAPSPTGFLHVGGARTALFNYLFSKKYDGKFILRLEDTDVKRSKEEFSEDMMASLKWIGIEWDEGPDVGGAFGPYLQSERKALYRKYLEKLLEEDRAYWCFCSPEDLKLQRDDMVARGEPPRYSGKCSAIPKEEAKARRKAKEPAVLRFRMSQVMVSFEDEIRGKIEVSGELIGDFIIAKNFSNPLYNFAAVIDDYLMQITHVIRGEEHLSNTPKQIAIAKAFGFSKAVYAHLPLILAPDRAKLSKRHGASSIREYRDAGYLPEAVVNFIALLGWNPGDEREKFSLHELKKEFSLERVQKSGAVFNVEKLRWLNASYIRSLPPDVLLKRVLEFFKREHLIVERENKFWLPLSGEDISREKMAYALELVRERAQTLSDFPKLARFLFVKDQDLDYDKEALKWQNMEDYELKESLEQGIGVAESLPAKAYEDPETLKREFTSVAERFGDRGRLLFPLRVALTGLRASPGLFEIMAFLGKRKTTRRFQEALKKLSPLLVVLIVLLFTPLEHRRLLSAVMPETADGSVMLPSAIREAPVLTGFTFFGWDIRSSAASLTALAQGPNEVLPGVEIPAMQQVTSFNLEPVFRYFNNMIQPILSPVQNFLGTSYERVSKQEYIMQIKNKLPQNTFSEKGGVVGALADIFRWLFTFFGKLFEIISQALIKTGSMF